jgi:hypothetical protein
MGAAARSPAGRRLPASPPPLFSRIPPLPLAPPEAATTTTTTTRLLASLCCGWRRDIKRGGATAATMRLAAAISLLPKCSTNCQREESGGKSTKCVHESIHNFLKQKSNTNSTESGSSRAYKSNKEHVPREPGHGWPRPGRRAWPPTAMKSNTPKVTTLIWLCAD